MEQLKCLESKIDQLPNSAMLNNGAVKPGKLTLGQILSVRCPMCGAKPKQRCTLSTGHPSTKTHIDRELAAAKVPPSGNSGQAALRALRAFMSRGFRGLFQHK
jgi:hypothetical protein